jgi:hypothetical protein
MDVSHLSPGTAFVCGSCGQQLTVPGAAPAPAPAGARRPARRERGGYASRRPAARPRSNTPLILAGIGLVTAVVVVVLILAFSRKSETPERTTPVATPPRQPSTLERVNALRVRYLSGEKDPAELRAVHLEAKELGVTDLAEKAARAALECDDGLAWAHEALGHVRYDPTGLPDDDEVMYPTEDWDLVQAAAREAWLTPERATEVAKAKGRFLEHMKKLETDGHYKKVCHWRVSIRKHPVFRDYDYKAVEAGPYLIFIQHSDDDKKAKAAAKIAKHRAAVFTCLYERFMKEFGERFGLEPLQSKVFEKDVILKCWVFSDRKAMDKFHEKVFRPIGANVAAYYVPHEQWMMIPVGAAGNIPKIGGQDMDTNVCLHEGTHQLMHHVTKRIVEEELGEEISWTHPRLNPTSVWFREGLAEYFGSAVKKGDSWEPFALNVYRLMAWKMILARKLDVWTLKDLLNVRNNAGFRVPGKGHMGSQFYGQSWAFVYFLNHYKDGKYRDKFLEYFKREVHGESGLAVFKEVFGVEEVEGSEMEKEFTEYCEELLKKAPEMRGVGGGGR